MLESKFSGLLRPAIRQYGAHVDKIETGETGRGVPDLHIHSKCKGTYWCELKVSRTKTTLQIDVSPAQILWHEEYSKLGGRSFLVVYNETDSKVYLFLGRDAREAKAGKMRPYVHFTNIAACAAWLEN
jgi:hypothetical protein